MVERFFHDLTENRLRLGVFRIVLELIEALDEYVDLINENPTPSSGSPKLTRSSQK